MNKQITLRRKRNVQQSLLPPFSKTRPGFKFLRIDRRSSFRHYTLEAVFLVVHRMGLQRCQNYKLWPLQERRRHKNKSQVGLHKLKSLQRAYPAAKSRGGCHQQLKSPLKSLLLAVFPFGNEKIQIHTRKPQNRLSLSSALQTLKSRSHSAKQNLQRLPTPCSAAFLWNLGSTAAFSPFHTPRPLQLLALTHLQDPVQMM
jgi:hypothetical protein